MAERFGTRGTRILFRVGWWAIVVLTGLFTLNHLVGAVAFASSDDERMMFLVFAGMQALSLVVLFVPYRRAEWWAWWATWIPVGAMVATFIVFPRALGALYGSVGGAMALAQFATLPRFRQGRPVAG